MNKTLEPQINQDVQYDFNKPACKLALRLLSDDSGEKITRDNKNKLVEEMIEAGFTISSPDGLQKIHSKMLMQAILKVVSRLKPLDAEIHGNGASPHTEKIVTNGIRTVADVGEFDSALRDKMGAYYTTLMYGDGFTGMWGNPKKKSKVPFIFSPVENSNVYVNSNAIKIRGHYGKSVTQMLIVVPLRWDEAIKAYPKAEKIAGSGRLPTSSDVLDDTFSKTTQEIQDSDITEIGYLYDIVNENYTVIMGAGMTVVEEYWGGNYPFIDFNDDLFIPVMQHICIPSQKGFYNYGIGDIIYELAIISQQMLNMGIVGSLEEALPIDFVNVPKGKANSFLNQINASKEMRMNGQRPFVANEYDPASPGSSQITLQTLQTQYGTRWSQLIELLNRELLRFGINLDEAAYQPNATATEVLQVEQAQITFAKQMMENNASEYEFFYNMVMNMIEEYIPETDKTPINMTVTIYDDNGMPVDIKGITFGMLAKELKERHYFAKVNSRSGAIPSGVMEQAGLLETLRATPPGSPAYFRSVQDLYSLHNRDVSLSDLGFQGTPQGGAGGEIPENVRPTATERTAINVRSATPQPSIL